MSRIPPHLVFLEELRLSGQGSLADYYPETAAGTLPVYDGDELFSAGGLAYIAAGDGRLVPVDAEGLEPMEENIWDPNKLAALVDAAESGSEYEVIPGYADLWMDDGTLMAQVRDGNHRTFAPILAGSDFSWVWISDRTKQELDERAPGTEKLYRAIRAAQRAHGAPQFKRRKWGRIKKESEADLLQAERRYVELGEGIDEIYRNLLKQYGFPERGQSPQEQLRRPMVFWSERAKELRNEKGMDWYIENLVLSPSKEELKKLREERVALGSRLYDLRQAAGLQHGESLDPSTGAIVRANPDYGRLKRKLMR